MLRGAALAAVRRRPRTTAATAAPARARRAAVVDFGLLRAVEVAFVLAADTAWRVREWVAGRVLSWSVVVVIAHLSEIGVIPAYAPRPPYFNLT